MSKLPFTISFEKRVEEIPRWLPAATSVAAVILAFIISGIILKLIGGEPLVVGRFFFEATFGSWRGFWKTVRLTLAGSNGKNKK